MSFVIVNPASPAPLLRALREEGLHPLGLEGRGVSPPISGHPDSFFCRLGRQILWALDGELRPGYPGECSMNALVMGGRLYGRIPSLSPRLLAAAEREGLDLVPVRQGYAACAVLALGETAAITADEGMGKALKENGVHVLIVSGEGIALPGYDNGFWGGAATVLDRTVWFFGDAAAHPDWPRIRGFLGQLGIPFRCIDGFPLSDLGGLIRIDELPEQSGAAFSLTPLL